jgi:quinol monooxygenase YgiN
MTAAHNPRIPGLTTPMRASKKPSGRAPMFRLRLRTLEKAFMHRQMIKWLALAALLALSGGAARADEQVVIVERLYPAPGREAELEARLLRAVKFVKQAEPNITYRLHRSVKEPTMFLYHVLPSQAALDRHRQTIAAFRQEAGQPPEGIYSRPPEIEYFGLLAE